MLIVYEVFTHYTYASVCKQDQTVPSLILINMYRIIMGQKNNIDTMVV